MAIASSNSSDPDRPEVPFCFHPLGRGRRSGQTVVKLVFDVRDVETFCADASRKGLLFGKTHKADGYVFANAKDPAGNSISVSSRAFRNR